jgi:hypothetical protein
MTGQDEGSFLIDEGFNRSNAIVYPCKKEHLSPDSIARKVRQTQNSEVSGLREEMCSILANNTPDNCRMIFKNIWKHVTTLN